MPPSAHESARAATVWPQCAAHSAPRHESCIARTVASQHPRRAVRNSGPEIAGVVLTHADRVLYPEQGLTKLDLARYYERIHASMLPGLAGRPLALVRCPRGRDEPCFFQRHPSDAVPEHVGRVETDARDGSASLCVDSLAGLVALVQIGALELHSWGSRAAILETPDVLVFDLDPDRAVEWVDVVRAARDLGTRLEALGLAAFPKLTGGKGLHLVVPLEPAAGWDEVHALARAVAERAARAEPTRFVAKSAKAERRGRIFVDYQRNARGATVIASYSTRARSRAPVAVPIAWDELAPRTRADRYTALTLPSRLAALSRDPWEGFDDARRRVTPRVLEAAGAGGGS